MRNAIRRKEMVEYVYPLFAHNRYNQDWLPPTRSLWC